jgi:hypothetical protein
MMNLDLRLNEINKTRQEAGKSTFDIPVYYFTELIGLALGGKSKELGLDRHFYPAKNIIKRVGLGSASELEAAEAVAAAEAQAAKKAAADAKQAAKAKANAETADAVNETAEDAPQATPAAGSGSNKGAEEVSQ